MTRLELVKPDDGGSLASLSQAAQSHHAEVMATGRKLLEHALRAGDALLAAKAQVRHGEWYDWLVDNTDIRPDQAALYMRMAKNRGELEQKQIAGVAEAEKALRGAPDTRYDPEARAHALDYVRTHPELTMAQAAANLSMPQATLYRWVNPQAEDRYRQRHAERSMRQKRADSQRDRDDAVTALGSQARMAYRLVQTAGRELDAAIERETNTLVKEALRTARKRLRTTEDEIVRGARVGR